MEEARSNDGLKYVGDGTALVGVPARDLTAEEVEQMSGELRALALASGLYALVAKKVYTPKPSAKSALKGSEAEA